MKRILSLTLCLLLGLSSLGPAAFAAALPAENGVTNTAVVSDDNIYDDGAEAPEGGADAPYELVLTLLLPEDFFALHPGETLALTLCVQPADARIGTLEWSCSDESVMTVDQAGLVSAHAAGEAIISAAAMEHDGLRASISLSVLPLEEAPPTQEPTESPDGTPQPQESMEPAATPELTVMEASVSLLREGNFPDAAGPSPSTFTAAAQRLRSGLTAMEFEIDVSEFELEPQGFHTVYQTLLNEELTLFYVGGEYSLTLAEGLVQSVTPTYTSSAQEAQSEEWRVQAVIRQILSDCISPGMSDTEKALAVADYFCVHFSYAYDGGAGHNYTHLLLENRGVCQAFSDAYSRVMRAAGIADCVTVNSSAMTHSWNMIRLDGEWYHVDNTWNDRYNSRDDISPGYAQHRYFLLSDAAMLSADYGHYGIDNHPEGAADSTKYDKYFWKDVDSPICVLSGAYYYPQAISGGQCAIIRRSVADAGEAETILTVDCQRPGSSQGVCMCLAQRGGRLYYNTASQIRSCLPDGSDDRLETEPELSGGAAISRMYVSGAILYYGVGRDNYLPDYMGTYTIPVQRPLTGVSLPDTLEVSVGTSGRLAASVIPSDASLKTLSFESDAPGVLSIDEESGMYQALALGTANVTATAADGRGASAGCLITVLPRISSVSISGPAVVAMTDGDGVQLTAAGIDAGGSRRDVTSAGKWLSSDSRIATVDGGLVLPIKPGKVTITCLREGKTGKKTLTVAYLVDEISVTGPTEVLRREKPVYSAALTPSEAKNTALSWTVENGTGTASIDAAGKLSCLTPGTVTVAAKAKDWAGNTGRLEVNILPVMTESIAISQRMAANAHTTQLKAEILPADADDKSLTWSITAGGEFASIDGETGRLTGTATGTVRVRATAMDGSGVFDEADIEIVDYGVTVAGDDSLAAGRKLTLKGAFTPSPLTNTRILWQLAAEDAPYASIAGNNMTATLTAKAVTEAHRVTVTASSADDSAAAAIFPVDILPLAASVRILSDGEDATGGVISVDLNSAEPAPLTLGTALYPADAVQGIKWTSSDTGNTYATYRDNGDGTVTVDGLSGRIGTVTLTAAATDGSKKTAAVKISFGKLAQELNISAAKTQLRGGERLQIANDVTSNRTLTDRVLLWTLSDQGLPYASISSTGLLTTRPVPKEVSFTVTAAVKAKPQVTDSVTVILRPAVQRLELYCGADNWSGSTQPLESGTASLTLCAAALPVDAEQSFSWKSSSTAIATVDENGVVTPRKTGTVTITATADDGSKKSVWVKLVIGRLMQGLSIVNRPEENEIRSGKYLQLKTAYANAPTNKGLVWSFADPGDRANASLSAAGRVTAKTVYQPHEVTVRVAAKDGGGAKAEYTLRILPSSDTQLNILDESGQVVTRQTLTLGLGKGSFRLAARTLGAAENEAVTWKSSSPAYISVNAENGVVTLLRKGRATITATSGDKRTATVTVNAQTLADSITVTSKAGSRAVASGMKLTLAARVLPTGATNKALDWSVSDKALASVSTGGVLTAKPGLTAPQNLSVTAKAKDGGGTSGSFTVTVYPLVQSLSITRGGQAIENTLQVIDLNEHQTLPLEAVSYPLNALQDVVWGPTNTRGAAYVDSEGTLHLARAGTVTITAAAKDGSGKKASFKLTVLARAKTIELKSRTNAFQLPSGGKLSLYADFGQYIPTNKGVTWRLAPEDAPYATITSAGVLTAKRLTAPRTLTVTAASKDDPTVSAEQSVEIVLAP